MYNPIKEGFYPIINKNKDHELIPLANILLGQVIADSFHPDPAIQAFLRYIPSLMLQVLDIDLDEDEWNELTQNGIEADCIEDFRERVSHRLSDMTDFFTLFSDRNGFYQHYDVKEQTLKGEKGSKVVNENQEGLDGLLIHSCSGNNPVFSKRPALLQKLCQACALVSLIHHNYFCLAGLAGPANIRGNQAYLCMIGESNENGDDSFRRMIRNTIFPKLWDDGQLKMLGWEKHKNIDKPSWQSPGRKKGKLFEVPITQAGLIRSILHTPRQAFFETEQNDSECDLCGLATPEKVTKYYWRQGDKISHFIAHPTLATYDEKEQTLPLNYNPSTWRSLGAFVIKDYQTDSKRTFSPAPLVKQFLDLRDEEGKTEFQLELQAFQTDKAKLLGFHFQTLKLPLFKKDEEAKHFEFYGFIESFSSAMSEMLSNFRSQGTKDKKRSKVQIPKINDKHNEFLQRWGGQLMNMIIDLQEAQEKEIIADQLSNQRLPHRGGDESNMTKIFQIRVLAAPQRWG